MDNPSRYVVALPHERRLIPYARSPGRGLIAEASTGRTKRSKWAGPDGTRKSYHLVPAV